MSVSTPFSDAVDRWRSANGCSGSADATAAPPAAIDDYRGCAAPLRAITVDGLRHRWTESDDALGFSMSAEIVRYFDR